MCLVINAVADLLFIYFICRIYVLFSAWQGIDELSRLPFLHIILRVFLSWYNGRYCHTGAAGYMNGSLVNSRSSLLNLGCNLISLCQNRIGKLYGKLSMWNKRKYYFPFHYSIINKLFIAKKRGGIFGIWLKTTPTHLGKQLYIAQDCQQWLALAL